MFNSTVKWCHCVLSLLPLLCQVLSEKWITEQRCYKQKQPKPSGSKLLYITAKHTDAVKGYLQSYLKQLMFKYR